MSLSKSTFVSTGSWINVPEFQLPVCGDDVVSVPFRHLDPSLSAHSTFRCSPSIQSYKLL